VPLGSLGSPSAAVPRARAAGAAAYPYKEMAHRTLIDSATLATHLDDPLWVIVDCRFMLADPEWGSREYLAGHIPGAAYAHLEKDLSGEVNGHNGRHPLPTPKDLERTLGEFGIAPGVQVVAYDQDNGMFASRLWWLLRWMGHDEIAVLDGGLARWVGEHRPTASGAEKHPRRSFPGSPRPDMVADLDEVARMSTQEPAGLIDVRAPERYRGETEPIDRVAGHIPGAINDPFMQNVDERGLFRPPDALRARLTAVLGNVRPEDAVCYCGSGVTACHTLLALEFAGLHGTRLYPGSWSEWSSDPLRGVDTSRGRETKGPATS
jgi:thiosulfate/3-mercaptopyruvate sulfurtransferase